MPTTPRPHLQVVGLSKVFKTRAGAFTALDGVDFSVGHGEFVSLLGPSGCGKSTLLGLVAGLDRPTRGKVLQKEHEVIGPNVASGVVFQTDLLLSWRTALENVLLQFHLRGIRPTRADVDHAKELLGMVGVGAFLNSYPHELSGGMRQRVAICRALVHGPDLLLMDEPFGALDAITREQINLDLSRIARESDKTVLFVTHSIEEAAFLSDRVLVMATGPGRILAEVKIPLDGARTTWPVGNKGFDDSTKEIRELLSEASAGRAAA